MKCKGCKLKYYCSRECQKIDWNNGHKYTCKTHLQFPIKIKTNIKVSITYI